MATQVDVLLKSIFNNDVENDWKVSEKIQLIAKEIDNLKQDVKTYLEKSDYDISEIVEESKSLCLESSKLIQEMESCQTDIENDTMTDITRSIEKYDKLLKEQETNKFKLDLVTEIITCSESIKYLMESKRDGFDCRVINTIYELVETLEDPIDGYNQLAIYHSFKSTADNMWDTTKKAVKNSWENMFSWNKEISKKETTVTLYLKMSTTSNETIEYLVGLSHCNQLQPNLKAFSDYLLKEAIEPIVSRESRILTNLPQEVKIIFCNNNLNKPHYEDVIKNIKTLFNYLIIKLNVYVTDEKYLMEMIGDEIRDQFSEMLTKDCFINTVPNTASELESYSIVLDKINELQQYLIEVRFYPPNTSTLLNFIYNFDTLFAAKTSQHYLESARTLMIKDLSQTMSIGVESVPETHPECSSVDSNLDKGLHIFDQTIPQSLYYFPRCMISKSTQELLDLINIVMEQAGQSVDEVSRKLYVTARLIFELYDAVVPYHHENFLQTIPQYVALFHNNCMYLAHNLLTFGDKWRRCLEDKPVEYPIGFLDLALKLRELGCKHLAIHLQQQRKQILDNIRSSDLNSIVVKDVLSENAEQAIRQCLRQLQLLKNVWIGVLPVNVFTRLMATLVNMFVDEIIHRVCTVEDISAEMATQLTEIYTIVVKKAPNLFQSPDDIEVHVKSWIKLQELILVLGGSLKDIEKRWNEGTGPLALHFRTEELRNLIKALFQNTQLRANLLSKIK